ncbi:tyrosine-type recombinase/integrase [Actinocrinis sp.]|uniref:tyrosine-type recombinase/integrase n=1 Tax=Actinocrinis sp. TaxID=1920516 RepID=UPI002D69D815|nr:tyrosine-type recombinase/integrase [Actinocrinis sp.]HZP50891.1 tyrosine-type recombinase/integrase [Actinocrinis sp.]
MDRRPGYVFTNRRGQPLHPEYLYYALKKLIKQADLPPIRRHDLRHTAASLALQAGADLKVVSDQLGHSSIVLTADTYISVLPPLALKAAEATTKLIAKAGRRAPGSKKPRHRATPARVSIRPPRSTSGASPAAASSGGTINGAPIDTRPATASQARSRAERSATGRAVVAA